MGSMVDLDGPRARRSAAWPAGNAVRGTWPSRRRECATSASSPRATARKTSTSCSGRIQVGLDLRGTYDFAIADKSLCAPTGVSKSSDGYQDVYDFATINPAQAGPYAGARSESKSWLQARRAEEGPMCRERAHRCVGLPSDDLGSITLTTDY